MLFPLLLYATGFLRDEERRALAANLSPAAIREAIKRYRDAPAEDDPDDDEPKGRGPRLTRETLEAEQRDEDSRGPS